MPSPRRASSFAWASESSSVERRGAVHLKDGETLAAKRLLVADRPPRPNTDGLGSSSSDWKSPSGASRSTSGCAPRAGVWARRRHRHRHVHPCRQVPGAGRGGRLRRPPARRSTTGRSRRSPSPTRRWPRWGHLRRGIAGRRARSSRPALDLRAAEAAVLLKVFADPAAAASWWARRGRPGGGRVAGPADPRHPRAGADRRHRRHHPALPDLLRAVSLRDRRPRPPLGEPRGRPPGPRWSVEAVPDRLASRFSPGARPRRRCPPVCPCRPPCDVGEPNDVRLAFAGQAGE